MPLPIETFNAITALALKSREPTFHKPAFLAPDEFFTCLPGEEPNLETAPPRPRRFTANTVSGLIAATTYLAQKDACTVFVGRDEVTVVVGERDRRRDLVTLTLVRSEPFGRLADGGLDSVKQRDLVWILRSEFSGQVVPESLLPQVRQVKFRATSEGEASIQTGRESMGRDVLAEMTGAGDWPDEVEMRCPVYENIPESILERARIRCAFDVRVDEQKFRIVAMPGELESASAAAIAWLAGHIREHTTGTPCPVDVLSEAAFDVLS